MDSSTFKSYPLQIVGISSDYDSLISEVEAFVVADMAYTGEANFESILPFFVFWALCQNAVTTIFAETGENTQIKEFSEPAMTKQIVNWNTGVSMLRAALGITDTAISDLDYSGMTLKERLQYLIDQAGISINLNYLSKRSIL